MTTETTSTLLNESHNSNTLLNNMEKTVTDKDATYHQEISGFAKRHIGPSIEEISKMLDALNESSIDELINKVVPKSIHEKKALKLKNFKNELSEEEALKRLKKLSLQNKVYRSYIGMGYYGTNTPNVIKRNILENPGWYTQYTPYQAEIAQGRLEALLNFQTVVTELTGLPIANASLLDEGTACAEAMSLSLSVKGGETKRKFFVDKDIFPQSLAVVKTRASFLGVEVVVGNIDSSKIDNTYFGVLVQYPSDTGEVKDLKSKIQELKKHDLLVTFATDLMALNLLKSPKEQGADIAVGSAQRLGVPFGFGGPHAAFFAIIDEYKRLIPGRIIGVSVDSQGRRALRLALQTREQHIRREKATSNICTAQVLLAVMASMYVVYHGSKGLKEIATSIHKKAVSLAKKLSAKNIKLLTNSFYDTLSFKVTQEESGAIFKRSKEKKINLGRAKEGILSIAIDETVTLQDLSDLYYVVTGEKLSAEDAVWSVEKTSNLSLNLIRSDKFLTQEVFNKYQSETEFLRYVKRLEARDLSLCHSMIPLGSCTMKLNSTAEMIPVTWEEFSNIHPFAPSEQTLGYQEMFNELEQALCDLTGFDKASLQPNAGSQGEYAGLLAIAGYQKSIGQGHRNICLIPKSAHGTNPASAVMAGLNVVVVNCDDQGNIDLKDLELKIEENKEALSCLMVTYPSTHGVFEEGIKKITSSVHAAGGQVYMDGANLNALVGLVKPGKIGMDVCHINLHKTFCIPHGGGGPGMGPIAVSKHLAPFLPGHPLVNLGSEDQARPYTVSAAPWGSASILNISWMYIAMMAGDGLTLSTKVSILNANYIANQLKDSYPTLYKGKNGYVAHECILDLREFKKSAGIEVEDVAKRLIDYGFHAPTVSWPVAGTLMVEPTESESKEELDRFCEVLKLIREEIREVEVGKADKLNNVLKNSPHTQEDVVSDSWNKPYSREKAALPIKRLRENKFWPYVSRVDGAYGDRNLVCACGGSEEN